MAKEVIADAAAELARFEIEALDRIRNAMLTSIGSDHNDPQAGERRCIRKHSK